MYRGDLEASVTHVSLQVEASRISSVQDDRENELDTLQYEVHEDRLELGEKLMRSGSQNDRERDVI
jgi:hypothetical protein